MLKIILLTAIFFPFLLSPTSKVLANIPEPQMCMLKVHAVGFRSEKGTADAAIFSSPAGWPEGHNDFLQDASPITGGQSTISFHLPAGKYSVVVLDDENMDHKMDRNLLGVPTKGFGFSNNPHVFLRAPSFEQASINVTCPSTVIDVKMIYK